MRLGTGVLVVCVGWGALASANAHAVPGMPKKPAVEAKVPSLPEMSVADVLAALVDADRKLDTSANTLFSAQMSLLQALGQSEKALEYQKQLDQLNAEPASDERDAKIIELQTDEALIDAMVEALADKKNEVDDERKAAARKANVQIIVARLMAAATIEDAATIVLGTTGITQRLASGDETVVTELASQPDAAAYVAQLGSRAGGIKQSSRAVVRQSNEVSKVMDKYRKKRNLFEPISADEAQTLFAESEF